MHDLIINAVLALRGHAWSPAVFTAAYAVACLFAPISLFPIAGGVLFGFWGGLLCNLTGAMAGASLAFFLGRRLGPKVLSPRFRALEEREAFLFRSAVGFPGLLAVRLIGFPPFGLVNYLAGLSPMSWRVYLSATFTGMLPWAIAFTYSSHILWNIYLNAGLSGMWEAAGQHAKPLFAAGFLLLGLAGTSAFLKRRKKIQAGNSSV